MLLLCKGALNRIDILGAVKVNHLSKPQMGQSRVEAWVHTWVDSRNRNKNGFEQSWNS